MTTLITNIRQLVNVREENRRLCGGELAALPVIENAWLRIEEDLIAGYGKMEDLKPSMRDPKKEVDATGRLVLPAWCDSHTHLVFAGSREAEMVDKIKGLSYAEIAARGGGILHSAQKLNDTSEDELFRLAWKRLEEVSRLGTGSIEIKSGYGLSVDGELKMLRVIKKLKEKSRLSIKATFLGAHAYPPEYKEHHEGYMQSIIDEMLPVIQREKLADYIDVFCETGFFSPAETERICEAGRAYGLKPKLHVNQLHSIGGIEAGIAQKALSLDHLETLTEEDLRLLGAGSGFRNAAHRLPGPGGAPGQDSPGPICTLLPTAAFFLRLPFPPARPLIEAGLPLALASDYNPGSSPSGNMNLVVSMACIQMKMLPEEAINAATVNGAFAMELEKETGSISVGKKANLIFTRPVPSPTYLPYAFGTNLVDSVMIRGEWL